MGRVPSRCRGARSFVGGPLKRHLTTYHRRSVRLKGYDYGSPGAYFVTICTHQRQMFFDDPVIRPIAETCWRAIPEHAQAVELARLNSRGSEAPPSMSPGMSAHEMPSAAISARIPYAGAWTATILTVL